jgi:hypothetical protein
MTGEISSTDLDWVKSLVHSDQKKNVKEETAEIKKMAKPVKATSKLQELLKDFYERLEGSSSPDAFDKFYADKLKDYKARDRFGEALHEIAISLKLNDLGVFPQSEKEYQALFFTICEKANEAGENEFVLGKTKDYINAKYPGLIDDNDQHEANVHIAKQEEQIQQTSQDIADAIMQNKEKYAPLIAQVEKAKTTGIDEIAEKLNDIAIIGVDIWKMIIYAMMSTYCPKPIVDGVEKRNNAHILFVGDISTSKSLICSTTLAIAPKASAYSGFTKANFEGAYDTAEKEIGDGVIDEVKDGLLVIKEYTPDIDIPHRRELMDNDTITFGKGGDKKVIENPNTTFLCACNPSDDFFQTELLRGQVHLTEGELSRFDIMIPIINRKEDNARILRGMKLFGGQRKDIELGEINLILSTLSEQMKNIIGVSITEEQEERIKQAYFRHNVDLEHRPMLILRDVEVIIRLLNVITCINFPKNGMDKGIVKATDENVDEAICLWESLMEMRKSLYINTERRIDKLEDIIYLRVAETKQQGILKDDLRSAICRVDRDCNPFIDQENRIVRGLCSVPTYYRKLKDLTICKEPKLVKKTGTDGDRYYAVGM